MADAFYEVDEQLRAARLKNLFQRGWPYAVGLVVAAGVVALGVWGWTQYEQGQIAKSSTAYAAAAQAQATGDAKTAQQKFEALGRSGTPAYRALALMQEADIALKAKDEAGAVRFFDQAAGVAPNRVIGDAARLKAAYVLMDSAPYQQVYDRLQPLTDKSRPYRGMAREALAIERMATGRKAQAVGDFQVLALSQDSSEATRARANAALAMIRSGSAEAIGPIAKGAVGLTPVVAPPQPQGLNIPGGAQVAPGASQ